MFTLLIALLTAHVSQATPQVDFDFPIQNQRVDTCATDCAQ